MTNFIYYLIGFIVFIYIARLLGDKALKHLNADQKAGLIDLFTEDRRYGGIAIFCMVIGFLIIIQFDLLDTVVAFTGYFILMIVIMTVKALRTNAKLKANDYPPEYTRTVLIASAFATLGILIFFGLILYECFLK
jgi:hypothetical protein